MEDAINQENQSANTEIDSNQIDKNEADDIQTKITSFGSKSEVRRMDKTLVLGIVVGIIVIVIVSLFLSMSPKRNEETPEGEKYTNVKTPDFASKLKNESTPETELEYSDNKFDSEISLSDTPQIETENPYSKNNSTATKTETYYKPQPVYNNPPPNSNYSTTSNGNISSSRFKRLLAEEEAALQSKIETGLSFNSKDSQAGTSDGTNSILSEYEKLMPQFSGSSSSTTSGIPITEQPVNSYKEQNMQDQKNDFYAEDQPTEDVIWSQRPNAPLGNLITAGTIIPGILVTAINSDNPGQILGMVTKNIYSFDGTNILIPQGTKMIANYNSSLSWNQKRLQIAWSRLILPNGSYLNLQNMAGVDSKGASGYQGNIDNHLLEVSQGLGFLAAFTLLNAEINYQANSLNSPGLVEITNATSGEIKEIGSKFVDRALEIQPTITVPKGKKINIFVNTDLALPVYK